MTDPHELRDNLHLHLEKNLAQVKEVFDIDRVLAVQPNQHYIARYYRLNKLAYSLFHDLGGFIHMGLSRDGKFKKEDLKEQAKLVAKYIHKFKAKNVLGLATGRGANSIFLAKKIRNVHFDGIDLSNGQLDIALKNSQQIDNFHPAEGDFHDLSRFPKGYFDIVFVIGSLCHSGKKKKVLQEVARVLRQKGLFIIFDGFSGKPEKKFNKTEMLARWLIERGMWVDSFEHYKKFISEVQEAGLSIMSEEDASQLILPTVSRYEVIAKRLVFNLWILGKLIVKFFPPEFTYNAISGYLMPDFIKSGLARYMILVAKKN